MGGACSKHRGDEKSMRIVRKCDLRMWAKVAWLSRVMVMNLQKIFDSVIVCEFLIYDFAPQN
jgi:hypothetical protein